MGYSRESLNLKTIKSRLEKINPDIEIMSDEYINARTKLKCKCKVDGYEFDFTWNRLQQGAECPRCRGVEPLTINVVKSRLKDINPDIEILSDKYKNNQTKLKCKCLIDGYEWAVMWNSLSQGTGCPECSGKKKLPIESFKIELNKINPNIKVLSKKYMLDNSKKRIVECECLIDGFVWHARTSNLMNGTGCPECSGLRRLTLSEVISRLKVVNPDIEIISDEYINAMSKLEFKCSIDGNIWSASWNNVSNGAGCPKCNSSKGEKRVRDFLRLLFVDFDEQHYIEECKNKRPLPFDFAIYDSGKSLTGLIEYDGRQHFEAFDFFGGEEKFKRQQLHDNIKNQYCKDNNIPLLRIPYWDFDDMESILDKWLVNIGLIEGSALIAN